MKILKGPVSSKLNVKRSIFVSNLSRVKDLKEAREFIKKVSRDHSDATHNCWAYRMISNGEIVEHSSDAGEPRGSAGLPILNTLRKHDLVNVVAVVSRYFGGVKLGIRGLIDAYSSAVESALDGAEISEVTVVGIYKVKVDYSRVGKILSEINSSGGKVLNVSGGSNGVTVIFASREPLGFGERVGEDVIEI